MKPRKAKEADDTTAELWKAKSWDPIVWFSSFFNSVIEIDRTSSKGILAESSNYRPI